MRMRMRKRMRKKSFESAATDKRQALEMSLGPLGPGQ